MVPTSRGGVIKRSSLPIKVRKTIEGLGESHRGSPLPSKMALRQTRLQLLWEMASLAFSQDPSPTMQQIQALQSALMQVPIHELGVEAILTAHNIEPQLDPSPVSPSSILAMSNSTDILTRPQITYYHIHEDENISLGLFFLPANAQIPLHNHPGMTVMSRMLYGNMHIKSYDWNASFEGPNSLPQDAHIAVDKIVCPDDVPTVLFPSSGGNIHQFTAVTPCVVLDVLSPPYSTDEGRDCTYFQELGVGKNPNTMILGELELPDEFLINSSVYTGVPIRTRRRRSGTHTEAVVVDGEQWPTAMEVNSNNDTNGTTTTTTTQTTTKNTTAKPGNNIKIQHRHHHQHHQIPCDTDESEHTFASSSPGSPSSTESLDQGGREAEHLAVHLNAALASESMIS